MRRAFLLVAALSLGGAGGQPAAPAPAPAAQGQNELKEKLSFPVGTNRMVRRLT